MSSISIKEVYRELFSAPLDAVCKAENDYRAIWASWIRTQIDLMKLAKTPFNKESITNLFDIAPVVKLDGVIETGLTMRIAEANKKDGEFSAGLQLGPIHATGRFGFSNQSSQESVFQTSTRFTISNQQTNLKEYLSKLNIEPADEASLIKAIELLEKVEAPASN